MNEQVALIEHACAVFEVGSTLLLAQCESSQALQLSTHWSNKSVLPAEPIKSGCTSGSSSYPACFSELSCSNRCLSACTAKFEQRASQIPGGVRHPIFQGTQGFPCLPYKSSWFMLIHVVQAAVALRDAAVRQWATMSKDDQRALRGYVLHYVLRYDSLLHTCLSKPVSRSANLMGSTSFARAAGAYYNCCCFCCRSISNAVIPHKCTNAFIPVCSQHIYVADRHIPAYNTWLLMKLTPKGAVFSLLFWQAHQQAF